jgi:putative tricarboxylic transport membrane protein
MALRGKTGDLALAGLFAVAGAFWVWEAAKLSSWDGFAPGSGFLPLIFGALLACLGLGAAYVTLAEAAPEASGGWRRPALVVLALAGAAAGIEIAGFFASTFAMMAFLFFVVERLRPLTSVATAAGVALALTGVFRGWLGVPLPAGPWGF